MYFVPAREYRTWFDRKIFTDSQNPLWQLFVRRLVHIIHIPFCLQHFPNHCNFHCSFDVEEWHQPHPQIIVVSLCRPPKIWECLPKVVGRVLIDTLSFSSPIQPDIIEFGIEKCQDILEFNIHTRFGYQKIHIGTCIKHVLYIQKCFGTALWNENLECCFQRTSVFSDRIYNRTDPYVVRKTA